MAGSFGGGGGGLSGGTYRDADGRVHYADGSVGPAVAVWNDGGNWVYAKNADVQGDIYRAQGLTPPGQTAANTKSPYQMDWGGVTTNTKAPYQIGGDNPINGSNGPYQMPSADAAGGTSNYTAGQNPYLQQLGDQMTQQVTQNMQRNVLPRIGSQAMAAGGYGGSRQGAIESNAMSDMNNSLASGLTNLYSSGYNQNLQYDLGLRGNDLGYAGLDAQINQNNFNNNLAGANFGLGVWNQGMANNQTGINAGTNIQNTPMNYWSQFGNQYNSIGQGFGATTGSASQQGNPLMGALGGAQLGSQIGNWWGGGRAGSAADTAAGSNFWAPNFSGSMGD